MKAVGVCRRYGNQEVLKDFSLALAPGSCEALMGPSGSGKSTFLHIAAGLIGADAGSVEIGGCDITKMGDTEATKFRRRHVGVVFQAFNLLNEKTVRDNILLPIALDGRARISAFADRLQELARRMQIDDRLDRKPEELSGGEQQRVAIARALIAEPDVVLADEPTGNLDALSARGVCSILKELNERCAILVVTHDPVVAASARRVHFLKDGRIPCSCDTNGDAGWVSEKYLETYR